jgi:hypothetical protein
VPATQTTWWAVALSYRTFAGSWKNRATRRELRPRPSRPSAGVNLNSLHGDGEG